MKVDLTEKEVGVTMDEDTNTYFYRINGDVKVENFESAEAAVKHAEHMSKMFLRQRFKKKI